MGGTKVITNIAKREPISVYDLKRKRSPNRKPIKPENRSHPHASGVASPGNGKPRYIVVKMDRNNKPTNNRMILTEREPTFMLARSKAKAVMVQNTAVNKAAISPK